MTRLFPLLVLLAGCAANPVPQDAAPPTPAPAPACTPPELQPLDASVAAIQHAGHFGPHAPPATYPTVNLADSGPVEHKRKASAAEWWSYLAGTSGTVTIAAGTAVMSMSAHSTAGGTLTICPQGPNTAACVSAGPTITIPANTAFSIPQGGFPDPARLMVADGTVFVFTGTDAYMITLDVYNQ